MSRLIVIGGGVRSGKSEFALSRACTVGPRRAFIATAQALDAEMRARIARHVDQRRDRFSTVEAPFDLLGALAVLNDVDVAVIDCLTLWLSNLLLRGDGEEAVARHVDALAYGLETAAVPIVLVTNEVGMGVVPETRLGRIFRDVAGRAHQRLAEHADELYFGMMGCIVRLRPGPIAIEGKS